MGLPTHYYEAISRGVNLTRYTPTPVDDFWDKAKPNTILVVLDEEHRGYLDAMIMLGVDNVRILTVKEHYRLPLDEWRSAHKFFAYNPVVGATS